MVSNGIQGLPNGFAAHVPVLASELVDLLDPQPGDTVIDCTFGGGGHANAAGCVVEGSLDEATATVLSAVSQALGPEP